MKKFTLLALMAAAAATPAAFAAEGVPFFSSLDNEEDFARWTAVDVDGNMPGEKATWLLANMDMGGLCATSWTDATTFTPVDNWLVSPAISLSSDTDYILDLSYYTSYYNKEELKIYLSTSADPSAPHTLLAEYTQLCNYYGGKLSIALPQVEEGDYYISFRHLSAGPGGMVVGIKNLTLDVVSEGQIAGQVTTYKNGEPVPLEGVAITFKGPQTYNVTTDAEGNYSVPALGGAYTVDYKKYGYESPSYPQTVTVTAGQTTVYNFSVYEMFTTSVSGKVTDNAGTALAGARVSLSGYGNFSGVTGSDGSFVIPGVYLYAGIYGGGTSDYEMTIDKNGYKAAVSTAKLSYSYYEPSQDLGTKKLEISGVAPYDVTAADNGSSAEIIWKTPADIREFKYDNGEVDRALGFDSGKETNIIGSVHYEPLTIHNVSWYRHTSPDTGELPEKVILYIMGLDEQGQPDPENFLYEAFDIESPLDAWTTYELPEPVTAPKGCAICLSAIGHVSVGVDSNTEAAPAYTQMWSNSYNGGYRYFEERDWKGALMIRANAEHYEADGVFPASTFTVSRYEEANAANPDRWTKLAEGLTTTSYTDEAFGRTPRGTYFYAVTATYPVGNVTSPAAVSGPLFRQMRTDVTVNVTADSQASDAEGARVTLKSASGETYQATVENGKCSFSQIWKDNYTLSIAHPGFTFADAALDFNTDETYTCSATLKQVLAPVSNIDIVGIPGHQALRWDLFADINDGFEGDAYEDFEVNPAGAFGWNYIDNDGLVTYGFGATTFPHMKEPMAAITMNSSMTEPPLGVQAAYSGDRFLGFFAAYPTMVGDAQQLNHSDDYFISPELSFHKDFTFSFMAQTYQSVDGRLENIRVGYSTTGKEIEDFTWLTEGYDAVPELNYTEYSYLIPGAARYVALNSYSDDVFMLCVDDVRLSTGILHSGEPAAIGAFNGYRLAIDGNDVYTGASTEYQLTGLADGDHTASIVKLYNGGESRPLTFTFKVDSSGISSITVGADGETRYYDLQGRRVVNPSNGIFIRVDARGASKVYLR